MKTFRKPVTLEETVEDLLEARSRINGLQNGKLGHGLLNGEVVNTKKGIMGNIHINPSAMGHASSSKIGMHNGLDALKTKGELRAEGDKRSWWAEPMVNTPTTGKLYGSSVEDASRYMHPRTYKLVNVLNDDGTPKDGLREALTEILAEASKDDANLYNEPEMSPGEISSYIDKIFEQLGEWFLEAKQEQEAGKDVTEHSTGEDEKSPHRYAFKDLKKEEMEYDIDAFKARQAEFINGIVAAGDDKAKIAEAIQPAVKFQHRMNLAFKTLQEKMKEAKTQLGLQIKGLEDDQFHGNNILRIFIQDPDAIFVASVGFWRNTGSSITGQKYGVGRQVDLQKKIVLMMPHRKAWNKADADLAYAEWRNRFNNGNLPDGTDVSRARTWISNKAGTMIDPKTGKPVGYSYKNFWTDVRFTAPQEGNPPDAFDEIIAMFTPKGAARFRKNDMPESPAQPSNVSPEGGIDKNQADFNVYTTDSEILVRAAIAAARKFGLDYSESDLLRGRAKAAYDREGKTLVVNKNQQRDMEMVGTIVGKTVDQIMHGGAAADAKDDMENEGAVSALFHCMGLHKIGDIYKSRAEKAARLVKMTQETLARTCDKVCEVAGQIADVMFGFISKHVFRKAVQDNEPTEDTPSAPDPISDVPDVDEEGPATDNLVDPEDDFEYDE